MKQVIITPLKNSSTSIVTIPGSKSLTNRALILAALTKGNVRIKNFLVSDDTQALLSCLQKLGIEIEETRNGVIVKGNISKVKDKTYILDAKLSGTTLRFLLALSCIVPGTKILTGNKALCKRPIKDLVNALRSIGAKIEYVDQEGFPPLKITSGTLRQGTVTVQASVSSQFLSALLMIAPIVGDLTVHTSEEVVSRSYIDLTKKIMGDFGVEVIEHKNTFTVKGQYRAKAYTVEGDYSGAAYFAAIAVLTKSIITLKNINAQSMQGDKEFLSILASMGNTIVPERNGITIIGKDLKPVSVNMENCPDQIQTLAVLAAFAKGETQISGISTLRVKETDRIAAIVSELAKMGIQTKVTGNTLHIFGGNPHAAAIDTFEDHRMAMAYAVAGTKLAGMRINDPDVVTKSFPTFWKLLQRLGVGVREREKSTERIVLLGFMGAGKSSIAPILAKRLQFTVVEMDEVVLKHSQQKSIKEIFEKFGEEKFRTLETKTAKNLQKEKHIIISAGGGVVMREETMAALDHNATAVFLSTNFETIQKRLVNTSDRPLWKNELETKKLFEFRKSLYQRHADIIVPTDGKSLGIIADEIIKKMEELL